MSRIPTFMLCLLLLLVPPLAQASLLPGSSGKKTVAAAGRLDGLDGKVSRISPSGTITPLQKGMPVFAGDSLATGAESSAELSMSDGSRFHLHPQTTFKIEAYRYRGKGDASESAFFQLLKGGLRTLTGAIGKLHAPSYRLRTPTATIGIRGTEYSVRMGKSLLVDVHKGEILLSNRSGQYAVAAGQSVQVRSARAVPTLRDRDTPLTPLPPGASRDGRIRIKGNVDIQASTKNTQAIAIGEGNTAVNEAGVIGGK